MLRLITEGKDQAVIVKEVLEFIMSLELDCGNMIEQIYLYDEGFVEIISHRMSSIYIKDDVIASHPLGNIEGKLTRVNICYYNNCHPVLVRSRIHRR